jgi:flagellar hook-associated protein 3 FlgL
MRVTFNNLNDGLAALNVAAAALDRAQDQLATGKRFRAASDDPDAAQRSVGSRAEISTLDAYTRTAESAESRLTTIDTMLSAIVERITEARVTTTSARGTTATPQVREAAARQLEGVRDAILGAVNTTVGGTYLFAGGQTLSRPYVQTGGAWTYQGDTTTVDVSMGTDRTVTVALDGQALLQGTDANNLLTELDQLAAAIRAGDAAGIDAGMAALDRAFTRAVRAQSYVGTDLNGIDENQQQIAALRLASQKRLSKDEDADMAKAASDLARADTAYRAALGAISTAGRVSLMDYLR